MALGQRLEMRKRNQRNRRMWRIKAMGAALEQSVSYEGDTLELGGDFGGSGGGAGNLELGGDATGNLDLGGTS